MRTPLRSFTQHAVATRERCVPANYLVRLSAHCCYYYRTLNLQRDQSRTSDTHARVEPPLTCASHASEIRPHFPMRKATSPLFTTLQTSLLYLMFPLLSYILAYCNLIILPDADHLHANYRRQGHLGSLSRSAGRSGHPWPPPAGAVAVLAAVRQHCDGHTPHGRRPSLPSTTVAASRLSSRIHLCRHLSTSTWSLVTAITIASTVLNVGKRVSCRDMTFETVLGDTLARRATSLTQMGLVLISCASLPEIRRSQLISNLPFTSQITPGDTCSCKLAPSDTRQSTGRLSGRCCSCT